MFGCLAVYVQDPIVLILRDKRNNTADNRVWLATTEEHHLPSTCYSTVGEEAIILKHDPLLPLQTRALCDLVTTSSVSIVRCLDDGNPVDVDSPSARRESRRRSFGSRDHKRR